MLRRLIAHEIIKQQGLKTATLHCRQDVLPVGSALAADLLTQLSDSFQKGNPAAGVFKAPHNEAVTTPIQPDFRQLLLDYSRANDDPGFVTLTRGAMNILKDKMVSEPLSTGGYAVFAEYDSEDVSFLLTALLRSTAKPSFDEHLNLVASSTLDLDHLRHGARIRLDGVADNTEGVAQFVSHRIEGVSEYFVAFIGCEALARPEVQGQALSTALDDWAKARALKEPEKQALKDDTYSYWSECHKEKRPMTLTELANAVSPRKPVAFLRHLGNARYNLAGEFPPPPPKTMKRFVRFAFNAHGLRLEFDRNQWMNKISVDTRRRTLTIRDVPEELIAAIQEKGE